MRRSAPQREQLHSPAILAGIGRRARMARLYTRLRGMTLIELLVTIAILVTVLAGVIPLISPNNNSRKIREASRQLNSLIQQAQARAARDGRPAGISFREFGVPNPTYSGMALEAYTIAEPQPFAGFSDNSRVTIALAGMTYGPAGNGGTRFERQYATPPSAAYPVCTINFLLYGQPDLFPPRMLRIGDVVEAAGNMFLICDDDDPTTMPNQLELDPNIPPEDQPNAYLLSDPSVTTPPIPGATLNAIWINFRGQVLPGTGATPTPTMYKIYRQPARTTDDPVQFPRGIGIDMNGSGATGSAVPETFDFGGPDVVSVMFNSNGSFAGLYLNGRRHDTVTNVFVLLGLFENGNAGPATPDWDERYDFIARPAASRDDFNTRRSQVNWLHPDAQWVSVNSAGRVITSGVNTSYDPTSAAFLDPIRQQPPEDQNRLQREKQLAESREYAQQMQQEGGR